jgi:hypothetical protein
MFILLLQLQGGIMHWDQKDLNVSQSEVIAESIAEQLSKVFYHTEQGAGQVLEQKHSSFGSSVPSHYLSPQLLHIPTAYKNMLLLCRLVPIGYGIREIKYLFHFFW